MSYILDALRKADAERERDPARGIHAHPVVAPMPQRPGGRLTMMAAAGVTVVAVAAAVWWWPRPAPVAAPIAAVSPPPPALVTARAAPVAPLQPATEVQPPAPPPPAEPYVTQDAVRQTGASAVVPPPAAASAVMAPVAGVPPAGPVAASPAPASTQPDRILNVAELPPDVLRDLPKLVIGGGVYSDNRAQRMLIVGGQVVGEGAELAPGLKLEEIRNKSAVLRFRGLRYSVGY